MARIPDYSARALRYCRQVISGEISSGKWIQLACQRQLDDLESQKTKGFPYRFDALQANRVAAFIELLPHVKGKWAQKVHGKPDAHKIRLQDFQCFLICSIFGWLRKSSGKRRFRKASIYMPRKNAKSTLAAGIGHWMAWKDGEVGAEVYSGATSEKQAWEVFGPARTMVKGEEKMREGLGIYIGAQALSREFDGSKFEPVIGNPGDGASPHCAIVDEYHEHPTASMYSTMLTGMGARDQPLLLVISTAGDNLAGPCYDDWLTVQKVLRGTVKDETHFGVIYAAEPEDDWTSEEALRKANPSYGVSVGEEFLRQQQLDAINNARKQGTFKTKHLNQWVQAREAFMNMQHWARCARPQMKLADFRGQRLIVGLDLASKVDIAAMELVFPHADGSIIRFGKYYLPAATVDDPVNEHYAAWAKEGWLTITPGNIIDFTQIQADIEALVTDFQLEAVAYDPHQATMLVTRLVDGGIPCLEFRPTVLNFSEPMKHVEALVKDTRLFHADDPVMTWMVSNVVARTDAKDNVYPRKERPENKIDGFVALVMAVGVSMVPSDEGDASGFFQRPVMS